MEKTPMSIRNYCGRCSDINNFMFLKTEKIKGLGDLVVFECNKCGEQQNIFRKDLKDVINNFNKWEKNKKLEDTKKEEVLQKNGEDIMTFEELTKNKPTLVWKQRMDEGDDLFTNENINATNEVLDTFINSLKEIGESPTDGDTLKCVKKVVISLNELNDNYDYFIETMEREELWEFITEAARIVGLESKEDITEEWREW